MIGSRSVTTVSCLGQNGRNFARRVCRELSLLKVANQRVNHVVILQACSSGNKSIEEVSAIAHEFISDLLAGLNIDADIRTSKVVGFPELPYVQ